MNFVTHIPEDLLESYAIGRISGPDHDCLRKHLLQCSICQINLKQIVEYVAVMKAATATLLRIPLKEGMERDKRVQAEDRMEGALP